MIFLRRWWCVLLLTCSGNTWSDAVFLEDFQDGDASGWRLEGRGDYMLTNYATNYSFRLTNRKAALNSVSILGLRGVSVEIGVAADMLEAGDRCVGEVSVDNGKRWQAVIVVEDGMDDGVTMHKERVALASFGSEATETLWLRLRADGDGNLGGKRRPRRPDFDFCWFDEIRVDALP